MQISIRKAGVEEHVVKVALIGVQTGKAPNARDLLAFCLCVTLCSHVSHNVEMMQHNRS
jgi:hypothetical protein